MDNQSLLSFFLREWVGLESSTITTIGCDFWRIHLYSGSLGLY